MKIDISIEDDRVGEGPLRLSFDKSYAAVDTKTVIEDLIKDYKKIITQWLELQDKLEEDDDETI